MTARRRVLVVREADGCPVFRVGDRMALDFPAVDLSGSTQVCALALAKLYAAGPDCEAGEAPRPETPWRCPRERAPVVFDVVEPEERPRGEAMLAALALSPAEAVDALRAVPVFRALATPALERLAARVHVERYPAGATVVARGALGRAYYLVYAGELEVVGYADAELSSVVSRLAPRDGFGEMSLLTGAPTAASVIASTAVTLLALAKEDFEALLRESPYVARAFTRLLAARLMATNGLLVKEGAKAFSGKLQEVNLATVLQVLADTGRSGTLEVDDCRGRAGRVGFAGGRPYTAALGELHGPEAVYALLGWDRGDFWFDLRAVPPTDALGESVTSLLLEGMRRLDEARRDAPADEAGPTFELLAPAEDAG